MSDNPMKDNTLRIVDTRDEQEISKAYELLGKYFKPSELESEEAIQERTLGEQKPDVKHGVLAAYRGDRMVCCAIYDHFAATNMVYVEYIATEVDERRHHVATSLLQEGIFGQYDADILIDIVDPKKLEGASQSEIDKVSSKSKFWDRQGARKIGFESFQQPDFEEGVEGGVAIDDGSFLAIIPKDPNMTEISAERLTETIHIINTECNGVENPEEAFPEMFEALKLNQTFAVSQKSLVEEVVPTTQEDCCQ